MRSLGGQHVNGVIDTDGIEGFANVEEYYACYNIFAEVPVYSFNEDAR